MLDCLSLRPIKIALKNIFATTIAHTIFGSRNNAGHLQSHLQTSSPIDNKLGTDAEFSYTKLQITL